MIKSIPLAIVVIVVAIPLLLPLASVEALAQGGNGPLELMVCIKRNPPLTDMCALQTFPSASAVPPLGSMDTIKGVTGPIDSEMQVAPEMPPAMVPVLLLLASLIVFRFHRRAAAKL